MNTQLFRIREQSRGAEGEGSGRDRVRLCQRPFRNGGLGNQPKRREQGANELI